MRPLRRQLDRIDLTILKLLQKRTSLSARIGQAKRRHGAVVYVPERERELLAHLVRLNRGGLPARAVAAIFREVLSSSRAAQGQAAIGLLKERSPAILMAGRWHFGACDEFQPKRTWEELAKNLESGALALVILTGEDLLRILRTDRARQRFFKHFTIVGDFSAVLKATPPLAQRVFIVVPRGHAASLDANQILILIECKSTVTAVKRLLKSMPDCPIHVEKLNLSGPRDGKAALVRLTFAQPMDGIDATNRLLAARPSIGFPISILGIYSSIENYGG